MENTINGKKYKNEYLIAGLIFLLAVAVRFINLGKNPLTDEEAKLALQAMEIARGKQPLLGTQPAYVILTAFNFFIFGTSNFLARFWPALAGSAMVLAPLAFKQRFGWKIILLTSVGLSLDPGLWGVSRQAGGTILAVSFSFLCLAAWESRRYRWAGILGALALLGGEGIWLGLLGLSLLLILDRVSHKRKIAIKSVTNESPDPEINQSRHAGQNPLRVAMIWGVFTLLLVGSGLLLVPNGLNALTSSLIEFLRGWLSISTTPIKIIFLALFLCTPLPLIFGISNMIKELNKQDKVSNFLGLQLLIWLLLVILYPKRQPADLVWVLVPLWILAAKELGRILTWPVNNLRQVFLALVITVVFLVFAWLDLISLPTNAGNPEVFRSRVIMLAGAILIMTLSLFLIASGWESWVAKSGFIFGVIFLLGIFTIASGINAAGLRFPASADIWQKGSTFKHASMLEETMNELSVWNLEHKKNLDVTLLSDLNSPALTWLLRDWRVDEVENLTATKSPHLILAPKGMEMNLTAGYRGQEFVLYETAQWQDLGIDGWLRWIAFRNVPHQNQMMVLWAREDLFANSNSGDELISP